MANVIKLGGNEIDSPDFLANFAQIIAAMAESPIIVHGGGKEIAAWQAKLGIEARFIEGMRVTDHAALAVAKALNADALQFVTNVPGVKIDGALALRLTPFEIETYIASGQIHGGMVPKVRSATDAIAAGVRRVVICDLDGLKNGE